MAISKGNNFKLIKKHVKRGEWDQLIMKGLNFILEGSGVIFLCSTLLCIEFNNGRNDCKENGIFLRDNV